jgi:hypothetical protein
MPETAHWYRMRTRRARLDTRYTLTALLQARLIVPEAGLTWLTENTDVFPLWLAAVAGNLDSAGALGGFITQAEARCAGADGFDASSVPVCTRDDKLPAEVESAPDGNAPEKTVNLASAPATSERRAETPAQDAGEAFLQWLVAELNAGHVEINTPTAHVHRVQEGLLLVGRALFRRYAREKEISLTHVQKQFLNLGMHRCSTQDADILTYTVPRARNRGKLTVKGLVIAEPEKLGLTLPEVDDQFILGDALQEAT